MGKDLGVGVHQSYKEEAHKGCDLLFRVKIKGRSNLVDDIPLHMSIKIFKNQSEFSLKELSDRVEELGICSPDPKDLTFEPIIFEAERTKLKYYMLKVHGMNKKFKELYNKYSNVGNVYKNFMMHITIDKELYDDAKKNGIKPEDIEFSHLILEAGAGNTVKDFGKSESLEKGLKHIGAAVAVAGAMLSGPSVDHGKPANPPKVSQNAPYSRQRMLNTIASVESQHGKYRNHAAAGGVHLGERAIGKYGLMPMTIRETISMHPDLKRKHAQATKLRGDDMRRYVEDNPGLEDAIANKHIQRLEHHFGSNVSQLGYAWLNGIGGTYKAQKENRNIEDHWHVKKIKDAWTKEK